MGSPAYSYYFVVEALAPVLETVRHLAADRPAREPPGVRRGEGRGRGVPAGPPGDQPSAGRLSEPGRAERRLPVLGVPRPPRPRLRPRHPAELGRGPPAARHLILTACRFTAEAFRRPGWTARSPSCRSRSRPEASSSPTGTPTTPGPSPAATKSGAATRPAAIRRVADRPWSRPRPPGPRRSRGRAPVRVARAGFRRVYPWLEAGAPVGTDSPGSSRRRPSRRRPRAVARRARLRRARGRLPAVRPPLAQRRGADAITAAKNRGADAGRPRAGGGAPTRSCPRAR